jgi:hypothetical protein
MAKATVTVTIKETTNGFGEKAFKFGTPSVYRRGEISYTLNSWKSKTEAKRVARREYGKSPVRFVEA